MPNHPTSQTEGLTWERYGEIMAECQRSDIDRLESVLARIAVALEWANAYTLRKMEGGEGPE
jgi:hypothetical protein